MGNLDLAGNQRHGGKAKVTIQGNETGTRSVVLMMVCRHSTLQQAEKVSQQGTPREEQKERETPLDLKVRLKSCWST